MLLITALLQLKHKVELPAHQLFTWQQHKDLIKLRLELLFGTHITLLPPAETLFKRIQRYQPVSAQL